MSIKRIANHFSSLGYHVSVRSSTDIDADLCFMAGSRHFVPSYGGMSQLMECVSSGAAFCPKNRSITYSPLDVCNGEPAFCPKRRAALSKVLPMFSRTKSRQWQKKDTHGSSERAAGTFAIWHGEYSQTDTTPNKFFGGNTTVSLSFMFNPIIQTLIHGVASSATRISYGKTPVPQDLGTFGLRRGDIFLWIGPVREKQVKWQALRSRGVFTIYYQSEPRHACYKQRGQVDETWDYSLHNIHMCKKDAKATFLRHVPPAAILAPQTQHSRASAEKIVFLGYRNIRNQVH